MKRKYCTIVLLFIILWNCSFTRADYHRINSSSSTDTNGTSKNDIQKSYTNISNIISTLFVPTPTDTHLVLQSLLPSESNLQKQNESEHYDNVTDNNDLDNSLVTSAIHHQTVNPVQILSKNSSEDDLSIVIKDDHETTTTTATVVVNQEPVKETDSEENQQSLLNATTGNENVNQSKQNQVQGEENDLASMQKKVKEMALKGLMEIFGLNPQVGENRTTAMTFPPPEFMIDLYNTITDAYGVTRAKNPYDAHIVRSLTERDNSLNDFFYFNVPKILEEETLLEAELHIYRQQTPHDQLHPSLYLTPFYILSLYQVLDPKNLAIPDLHKLLGVHYVPALGSGWEVFNVKQSVLNWMGEIGNLTNHGFLVAATSLGGDRVPVKFSRRGETLYSKQPILVLFTQDSQMKKMESSSMSVQKTKLSQHGVHNVIKPETNGSTHGNATEEEFVNIPTSSLENPRFHHALLYKDSIRHPNSVNRFRSRRSKNQTEGHNAGDATIDSSSYRKNLTACSRHDLFVNFEAIGWSTSVMIAPKGYNAFYCDGPCAFPMEQEIKPSNHATVQSIVHQLHLAPGLGQPCCVPTTLLPISLLYYDDEDTVVLKQYPQMVAESCGCS